MACSNPEVKGMCERGKESFKKLCRRCKWNITPEQAKAARATEKYNAKIRARTRGERG